MDLGDGDKSFAMNSPDKLKLLIGVFHVVEVDVA
jgi:hypothetical protein